MRTSAPGAAWSEMYARAALRGVASGEAAAESRESIARDLGRATGGWMIPVWLRGSWKLMLPATGMCAGGR